MKQAVGFAAMLLIIGVLAGCAQNSNSGTTADPNQPVSSGPIQGPGSGVQAGTQAPTAGSTQPGPSVTVSSGSRVGLPISNDAYQITEVKTLASARVIAVTGKLRAFEAVGAFAVKGSDGKVVKLPSGAEEGVIRASKGAPEWGDFTVEIPLPHNLQDKKLTLEFFVHSAKDGSRQQLLTLTVSLQ